MGGGPSKGWFSRAKPQIPFAMLALVSFFLTFPFFSLFSSKMAMEEQFFALQDSPLEDLLFFFSLCLVFCRGQASFTSGRSTFLNYPNKTFLMGRFSSAILQDCFISFFLNPYCLFVFQATRVRWKVQTK